MWGFFIEGIYPETSSVGSYATGLGTRRIRPCRLDKAGFWRLQRGFLQGLREDLAQKKGCTRVGQSFNLF